MVLSVIAWFRKLSRIVSHLGSRLWITSELPLALLPLALIGNASEQIFGGGAEILIRGVFDKEVRRKPLAFAADAGYAAGYGI
jgi:hypothetical protein